MRLFLDSANIDEIQEAFEEYYPVLSGLTTNPTFFYREGIGSIDSFFEQIGDIPIGELHVEAMGDTCDKIVEQCDKLNELNHHYRSNVDDSIAYKIPFSLHGLQAVENLNTFAQNIKTNVHLIYSVNQAFLALAAGATYVCPLMGRYDDIGSDSLTLIDEINSILGNGSILAASIRHPSHVKSLLLKNVGNITVPYKVLKLMMDHPLTERGILEFNEHESR